MSGPPELLNSEDHVEFASLQQLARQLPLERRAALTGGARFWASHGAPEIGLTPVVMSDGPFGVRGDRIDERDLGLCTPCGTALAASWDVDLVQRIGSLVGDEARRRGVDVVLGPTLNIQRSPLGGRGFECFSEDPLLSGTLGAAWIQGVQSRGVAATPKHFVCNDSESKRTSVNNLVDERALREIYLLPFELATRAGAWALMAAYNKVNGQHCSANRDLLRGVLKEEWGWDGLVISDWYADGETTASANAGLDLEMPPPVRLLGSALLDAIAAGAVEQDTVDDKVARVLRLAARVGHLDASASARDAAADNPPLGPDEAVDLLKEAAASGFVLLKDERRLLPLELADVRRLAVIGPNAADPCFQGGGSARVNMAPPQSLVGALAERLGPSVEISHERGCQRPGGFSALHRHDVRPSKQTDGRRGFTVEYFADPVGGEPTLLELRETSMFVWLEGVPTYGQSCDRVRISGVMTPASDGSHVFSLRASGNACLRIDGAEVVTVERPDEEPLAAAFDGDEWRGEASLAEGRDVLIEVTMDLPPDRPHVLILACAAPDASSDTSLERAASAAAQADIALLVVGTNEEIETEGADRDTVALDPNQEALIREVLAANPNSIVVVNAGAAVDLTWTDDASTVLYAWFPGQEFCGALADVLVGEREPAGRLPITIGRAAADYAALTTQPDEEGNLKYNESIFVGYRHFDRAEIEPMFCFGHGLGYGDFAYSDLGLSSDELACGGSLSVSALIRNVGSRRSKEVAQLYVHSPASRMPRAPRELKSFKIATLEPGEAEMVTFTLDGRAFAYWSPEAGGWRIDPGQYEIQVGRSSRDIRLVAGLTLS